MNLLGLIIPIAPITICLIAFSIAYLFSRAFESVSRNTDSADFIKGHLLIGAGLIELGIILIVGLFTMVFYKLV